jgi:metallophosphoesterase (TIGR00282 family)
MNFLIIGDVVGRSGRNAIQKHLKKIQSQFEIDFTILNGENSAGGYGITGQIYEDFMSWGIDAITLGNHAWKKPEIIDYIKVNPDCNIIRPLNFKEDSPGQGYKIFTHKNGKRILVSQIHGLAFIDLPLDNPFDIIDTKLLSIINDRLIDYSFLEVHAEVTSEKNGIAQNYDGKFTAIYGTHVHIPTMDARVLPKGTCFQTDIGMTGDYNSIIGMKKENAIKRMRTGNNTHRLEPSEEEATVSGAIIKTQIGQKSSIQSIQIGGVLDRNLLS